MAAPNREPRARVNGELIARAPRARVDKRFRNDDIAWLLVESRGELGERGSAIDPSGGGKSRDPSDTLGQFEQLQSAVPAVHRWRCLHWVWCGLQDESRRVLTLRYRDQERQHSEIIGLRGAFGELATMAWEMAADREALRTILSKASSKRNAVVSALRTKVEVANRTAHVDWLDVERIVAMRETAV